MNRKSVEFVYWWLLAKQREHSSKFYNKITALYLLSNYAYTLIHNLL